MRRIPAQGNALGWNVVFPGMDENRRVIDVCFGRPFRAWILYVQDCRGTWSYTTHSNQRRAINLTYLQKPWFMWKHNYNNKQLKKNPWNRDFFGSWLLCSIKIWGLEWVEGQGNFLLFGTFALRSEAPTKETNSPQSPENEWTPMTRTYCGCSCPYLSDHTSCFQFPDSNSFHTNDSG